MDVLLNWAEKKGAFLDNIEIRPSIYGRSVYAKQFIPLNTPIITIPITMIIHEKMVRSTQFGIDLVRFMPNIENADLIKCFLIYQLFNSSEPFHPYAISLPEEYDDPLHWSKEDLQMIAATNLYKFVLKKKSLLKTLFSKLEPFFNDTRFSFDLFLWAHSSYSSRGFSSRIIGNESSSGCLCPVEDMLNHQYCKGISWITSNGSLTLSSHTNIECSEEIFNNYGPKSNEELLHQYGFCLNNNPQDIVAVQLNASNPLELPNVPNASDLIYQKHLLHRSILPQSLLVAMRCLVTLEPEVESMFNPEVQLSIHHEHRVLIALYSLIQEKLFYLCDHSSHLPLIEASSISNEKDTCVLKGDINNNHRNSLLYLIGQREVLSCTLDSIFNLFIKDSLRLPLSDFIPSSTLNIDQDIPVGGCVLSVSPGHILSCFDIYFHPLFGDFFSMMQGVSQENIMQLFLLLSIQHYKDNEWSRWFFKIAESNTVRDSPLLWSEEDQDLLFSCSALRTYLRLIIEEQLDTYEQLFPMLKEDFPDLFPDSQFFSWEFWCLSSVIVSKFGLGFESNLIKLYHEQYGGKSINADTIASEALSQFSSIKCLFRIESIPMHHPDAPTFSVFDPCSGYFKLITCVEIKASKPIFYSFGDCYSNPELFCQMGWFINNNRFDTIGFEDKMEFDNLRKQLDDSSYHHGIIKSFIDNIE